jgi:hypothetical protein
MKVVVQQAHSFAEILKLNITYRQITAILFFAALLAQTFSRSFVIADYYTNTSKCAKDCINKARPKMHCNGKCQMMKKLQQEEKKDQETPDRKGENKIISLKPQNVIFSGFLKRIEITYPALENTGHAIGRSYAIFHQPTFS